MPKSLLDSVGALFKTGSVDLEICTRDVLEGVKDLSRFMEQIRDDYEGLLRVSGRSNRLWPRKATDVAEMLFARPVRQKCLPSLIHGQRGPACEPVMSPDTARLPPRDCHEYHDPEKTRRMPGTCGRGRIPRHPRISAERRKRAF